MTREGGRKLLWFVLRLAVSVGALVWVFWGIQWHDHVIVHLPGMAKAVSLRVLDAQARGGTGVVVVRNDRGHRGEQLFVPLADVEKEQSGGPTIQTGMRHVLWGIDWLPLAAALGLFVGVPFFASLRWQLLLRVQEIRLSVAAVLKLTWIGLFCNQFMPGMTGGDLVKAYYITKHTDHSKAEGAITILVDRVIGLLGLVWLSAAAMAVVLLMPSQRAKAQGLPWAWLTPGVVVLVGGAAFYSQAVRRALGINRLMGRLGERHMLRRLDRAVYLYRHHGRVIAGAFCLTFLSHVCLLTAVLLASRAIHLPIPALLVVVFGSLIFVASGLIPAVAGLGPLEAGFVICFAGRGIGTAAQSLTLALIVRLMNIFWALPGAVMLMLGSHLPSRKEMKAELEQPSPPAAAPAPAAASGSAP